MIANNTVKLYETPNSVMQELQLNHSIKLGRILLISVSLPIQYINIYL